MRIRWKAVAIFAAGLLIGASAMGLAAYRSIMWIQKLHEIGMVTDLAITGQQLGTGHADAVETHIEEALPLVAQQLARYLPDAETAGTLWTVRHYYEKTHRTAPAELAAVLAALPAQYEGTCPKTPRKPVSDKSQAPL